MTDGDFNVGISDAGELTRLIEQRAKSGVFLSVLGFGMGNLKDSTMERLAHKEMATTRTSTRPEDFNDDRRDAGEMGAGHTVTALFEIVPRGGDVPGGSIDPSVFQPAPRPAAPPTSRSNDLLVLRMRYKLPEASESTRMDVPFADARHCRRESGEGSGRLS